MSVATVTKSACDLVAGDRLAAMYYGDEYQHSKPLDLTVQEVQRVAVVGKGEMIRLVFGPSSESTVHRYQSFEVDALKVQQDGFDGAFQVMLSLNCFQGWSTGLKFQTREAAEFMAEQMREAARYDEKLIAERVPS